MAFIFLHYKSCDIIQKQFKSQTLHRMKIEPCDLRFQRRRQFGFQWTANICDQTSETLITENILSAFFLQRSFRLIREKVFTTCHVVCESGGNQKLKNTNGILVMRRLKFVCALCHSFMRVKDFCGDWSALRAFFVIRGRDKRLKQIFYCEVVIVCSMLEINLCSSLFNYWLSVDAANFKFFCFLNAKQKILKSFAVF